MKDTIRIPFEVNAESQKNTNAINTIVKNIVDNKDNRNKTQTQIENIIRAMPQIKSRRAYSYKYEKEISDFIILLISGLIISKIINKLKTIPEPEYTEPLKINLMLDRTKYTEKPTREQVALMVKQNKLQPTTITLGHVVKA